MIKCEGSPGQHSGHACLRLVAWMEPSPCESGT